MRMGGALSADRWIAGMPVFVFAAHMVSFGARGPVLNRHGGGGPSVASLVEWSAAFCAAARRQADACLGNQELDRGGNVASGPSQTQSDALGDRVCCLPRVEAT